MKFLTVLAMALATLVVIPSANAELGDVKVKIRWTEKTKKGARILTVFIKNVGFADLKKGEADIIILGEKEGQRQITKLPMDAPKNRETAVDIIISDSPGAQNGGFLGSIDRDGKRPDQPVGKVNAVIVSPSEVKTS